MEILCNRGAGAGEWEDNPRSSRVRDTSVGKNLQMETVGTPRFVVDS